MDEELEAHFPYQVDLLRHLREAAAGGAQAHELAAWVVAKRGKSFGLVGDYDWLFSKAFEIPLGVVRNGEEWEGFPYPGSGSSSEQFDELLQPYIEAWVSKHSSRSGHRR